MLIINIYSLFYPSNTNQHVKKGNRSIPAPIAGKRILYCWLVLFLFCIVSTTSYAQIKNFQKISDTQGNFTAVLDVSDDLGESVTRIGDLDLDSIPDMAITAEDDDDGGLNRGAIYILFMNTDGTVRDFQKISQTAGGFTGQLKNEDEFGNWITDLGDVDGDGITDIAVSAFGDDDGGINIGAIWILFLNRDGTVKDQQKISDTQGGFYGALNNNDCFGCNLKGLGDFDDDGVPDLAAGTMKDDDGGYNRGAVWLLMLNRDGTVKKYNKISETTGGFLGTLDDNDQFGKSVAAIGDYDNNGVTDIAVTAPKDDDGGTDRGAVWLLMMNADGTVGNEYKISDTAGGFTGDLVEGNDFGQSIETLGDLDGDGVVDVAVGAEFERYNGETYGATWILYLNDDGTVKRYDKIGKSTDGFGDQLDPWDEFGEDIAAIGDLDGDGIVEMVVTADADDDGGDHKGAAYVFFLEGEPSSNHPPVLDSIGNQSIVEGGLLTFTVMASDMDGDSIALSTSTLPPDAEFMDFGDGTGEFSYLPSVGASQDSPYSITFTATDANGMSDSETTAITVYTEGSDGAFQQGGGSGYIVSIEAENNHQLVNVSVHQWVDVISAQASNNKAMQALPDDFANVASGDVKKSPRLDYHINFISTGTHFLWVRGNGLTKSADSLHIGLDGKAVSSAADFKNFQPKGEYVWSNSGAKTIFVSTTGIHTLNIYMRESGFIVDKILLTTSASIVPTGFGPDESPSGTQSKVSTPIITPDPGSYANAIQISISTSTPDADIHYSLDGSDPTAASRRYTESFEIKTTTIVKAIACLEEYDDSDIAVAAYTIYSSSPGLFLQDSGSDGIVSLEAEDFHENSIKNYHEWIEDFTSGYSGTGAMLASPDSGVIQRTQYQIYSPQLDYNVQFVKTGIHYIWIRGYGINTGSDSIHAGLDGVATSTSSDIKGFFPKKAWAWAGGPSKTVLINSAGEHTVNLWMREDGFIVDKVVLTIDPNYIPSGEGPPESEIE